MSQSKRLNMEINISCISEGGLSPGYVLPCGDEEDRVMTVVSFQEGMSSSTSSIVSEDEAASMEHATSPLHQSRSAVEFSVPLDHVEEYPSPSSVSLMHSSAEDLSAIGFSIPTLPMHDHQNPHLNISVESSSALPSYRSRRRRRQDEEVDRSFVACDQGGVSLTQVDLGVFGSPRAAPSSLGSSISSSTSGLQHTRWKFRGASRFVMMLCAVTVVALTIHDRVEMSKNIDLRQNWTSSGSRREEVAFPLGSSEDKSQFLAKGSLPKYYLPKVETAGGGKLRKSSTTDNASNTKKAAPAKHHHGSNFAMARAREARPIFVPDQPLPGGGFRKPIERFVFDPAEQQNQFQEQSGRGGGRNAISWTSWLASVAFVGMLLETGWKEYHRCRLIQEEERRL